MPSAFRVRTISSLEALQRLIKKSTQVAEDMTFVTGQFREAGMKALLVSDKLKNNESYIKSIFSSCSDLVVRQFKIANNSKHRIMLVYIDGLVKHERIAKSVVEQLMANQADYTHSPSNKEDIQYLLGIRPEDIYTDMNKTAEAILNGCLALFIDGENTALTINFKDPPGRSVDEPTTEVTVRGPREGFTESIRTNVSLIRKKIKNTNLKTEALVIGKQTKTDIVVCYLANIANKRIVNEIKARLAKIDIDSILDSNYIVEYIQDSSLFIFPTIFRSEKPDVVAGKLLEGRVAIIVDGTPAVLTVPCLFVEFLQVSEDYYLKVIPGTLNRWLRFLAFFITITLPGVYTALLSFHQELIPDTLVPTIIKARAGVPVSEMMSCLGMLLVYEVLREAGVRMPRVIGSAVSIVGALVLGQAAVEAGLVSTPTVVLIGFTAIASLTIASPELNMSLILPRFAFLLLGGTLGLLGITNGILIFVMVMISERSFGVPYMGPLAPMAVDELKDVVVRAPLTTMFKRPQLITWRQSIRRKNRCRI